MNKIDTEKNRRKAKEKLTGYDVYLADSSLLAPLEAEKKPKIIIMCPNQQAMDDVEQLLQALSLLPPPCEMCGGSEKVPNPAYIKHCKDEENIPRHMRTRDNPYPTTIPCPACQALHQNGTGQASVGEIEELRHKMVEFTRKWRIAKNSPDASVFAKEAFTIIEAQAKQIAGLEASLHRAEEMLNEYRKRIIEYEETEAQVCPEDVGIKEYVAMLQAKIEQLEEGAFAANEEAQAKNDQIKRLEAANKGLEEEVWKLMLEMVKGSKGERQRINAELLEKRREAFGIQKG